MAASKNNLQCNEDGVVKKHSNLQATPTVEERKTKAMAVKSK